MANTTSTQKTPDRRIALSKRIFTEAAGEYPSIGELNEVLIGIYDRHLHEIPAGYGVARLIEAGISAGYIVRQPDRGWLVSGTPVGAAGSGVGK